MLRHLQHKPGGAVLHLQSIQDWGQPLIKLHIYHSSNDSHHPPLGPWGSGLGSCLGSSGGWWSCCWFGLAIGVVSVVVCGGEGQRGGVKTRLVLFYAMQFSHSAGSVHAVYRVHFLLARRTRFTRCATKDEQSSWVQTKWRPVAPPPRHCALTPRGGWGHRSLSARPQPRQSQPSSS